MESLNLAKLSHCETVFYFIKYQHMRYLLLAILVVACTKPGEKTGYGAAAGGAIGAGLGAIVGNQVGNTGQGMVVGAAAGAGTGALIANALEAQDEAMRQQDEAMERQEQLIRAQRNQMESMRGASDPRAGIEPTNLSRTSGRAAPGDLYLDPSSSSQGMIAQPIVPQIAEPIRPLQEPYKAAPLRSETVPAKLAEPATVAGMKPLLETDIPVQNTASSPINNKTCTDAQPELQKAESAQDAGDKLFHYRRALRICPEDPDTHVRIGDLYLSLGRKEDALFEYEEAKKLNSNLPGIQEKIESAKG